MNKMTPDQFESLKAALPLADQARLRPDGLMEPELPPLHLCGGLEAPYLVGRASPPLELAPTLSAPGRRRLSAG